MRRLGLAVAGLLLLAGCGGGYQVMPAAEAPPVNGEPITAQVAAPVSVSIPALGVVDEVVPVGLEPNGELEVPDVSEVGFYTGLPKPGENGAGPALLAGHVNYKGKVGSFARLGALKAGDLIAVVDADKVEHRFQVYAVREFKKADYAKIMPGLLANTDQPELRLVTCSGDVVNHNYLSNTVVSARLVT
jgi:sortase (surface protein transpeptidase)